MQNPSNGIPVLNGLRGLAVLIVFASRAFNNCYRAQIAGWRGGPPGVMLFFMLRDFLMAHLNAVGLANLRAGLDLFQDPGRSILG